MRNDISITDRIGNGIVAGFIATFVMSALHEPVALLTAAVGMRAPVGLLFHFFVGEVDHPVVITLDEKVSGWRHAVLPNWCPPHGMGYATRRSGEK